jgi:hypothetical protein
MHAGLPVERSIIRIASHSPAFARAGKTQFCPVSFLDERLR